MKELVFEIKSKNGLHARPAGVISSNARKYTCEIIVRCNGAIADAKRLISLMALGATCGKVLNIEFDGEDEDVAYKEIKDILFNELG